MVETMNERDEHARAWLAWASSFESARWRQTDYTEHLRALPPDTILHAAQDLELIAGVQGPDLQFVYTRGVQSVLDARPRVAVVGSRDIDFEGVRLARTITSELAIRGATIVSGGARGTDALAHRAALEVAGRTLSVLPCGIDVASPARNRDLFEAIAQDGLLMSTYPPGTRARKYYYHSRNELIASISDAVVIVRARARSGSRITAEHALRLGVPVWVVPGAPDDPHVAGCFELAEQGARIYRGDASLNQIIDRPEAVEVLDEELPGLDADGARIAAAIRERGSRATIDEVCRDTDLAVAFVNSKVMELELWGYCVREPGSPYVRLTR